MIRSLARWRYALYVYCALMIVFLIAFAGKERIESEILIYLWFALNVAMIPFLLALLLLFIYDIYASIAKRVIYILLIYPDCILPMMIIDAFHKKFGSLVDI
jgi:hypothetical protein